MARPVGSGGAADAALSAGGDDDYRKSPCAANDRIPMSSILSAIEQRDLLIIGAVCAIGSSLVVWRAFRRGRLLLR